MVAGHLCGRHRARDSDPASLPGVGAQTQAVLGGRPHRGSGAAVRGRVPAQSRRHLHRVLRRVLRDSHQGQLRSRVRGQHTCRHSTPRVGSGCLNIQCF